MFKEFELLTGHGFRDDPFTCDADYEEMPATTSDTPLYGLNGLAVVAYLPQSRHEEFPGLMIQGPKVEDGARGVSVHIGEGHRRWNGQVNTRRLHRNENRRV